MSLGVDKYLFLIVLNLLRFGCMIVVNLRPSNTPFSISRFSKMNGYQHFWRLGVGNIIGKYLTFRICPSYLCQKLQACTKTTS